MSEQVETVSTTEEPVKQNGTAVEVAETNEEKTESSGTQEDEAETDEAKSNEEIPAAAETVTITETVLEIAETANDAEPTYSQVVKVRVSLYYFRVYR